MPCNMKRLIALASVVFVSRAIVTFAGEPISQVIAPPPDSGFRQ
jgi:hypothetical protein